MPDGRTHDSNWKKASIAAGVFSCGFFVLPDIGIPIALGTAAGYLLGRYVTPDLDQIGLSFNEGELMRRFGFFGFLIVWWFMPYAYIVKYIGLGGRRGHRSRISHGIFIGSVIRWAWLLILPALFILFSGFFVPFFAAIFVFSLILGLSLADYIHVAADFGYFPFTKRRKRL